MLAAVIGRQPNLTSLMASNNPLTGAALEPISRLTRLSALILERTGITDVGLAYLEKTKTLLSLRVTPQKSRPQA